MGKSKKRALHNPARQWSREILTREQAIAEVVAMLKEQPESYREITELITLFGLYAEELLENGAVYEDIKILSSALKD